MEREHLHPGWKLLILVALIGFHYGFICLAIWIVGFKGLIGAYLLLFVFLYWLSLRLTSMQVLKND